MTYKNLERKNDESFFCYCSILKEKEVKTQIARPKAEKNILSTDPRMQQVCTL